MNRFLLLLLIVPIMALTSCIEEEIPDTAPQTVESVDIEQYIGLWYEIASYPQFFNIGCNCTTAEYEIKPDGNLRVTNKCKLFAPNGPPNNIIGSAVPVAGSNNTRLTVGFFGNQMGGDVGNYWIIELADDYSYAVVSDPFRGTWFLLSRTKTIDESLYEEIVDRAVQDGFIRSRIERTNQNGC